MDGALIFSLVSRLVTLLRQHVIINVALAYVLLVDFISASASVFSKSTLAFDENARPPYFTYVTFLVYFFKTLSSCRLTFTNVFDMM